MKYRYLFIITVTFFPALQAQTTPVAGTTREEYTTAAGETIAVCDQRYAIEMQRSLEILAGTMDQERLLVAQQYMIMVKQFQDLDFRIRRIERRVFDVPTIARLRMPLQEYQRCLDTLIGLRVEY